MTNQLWESLILKARAGDKAAHEQLEQEGRELPTGTGYRPFDEKSCKWCGAFHKPIRTRRTSHVWRGHLKNVYRSFDEFVAYCETYRLSERLRLNYLSPHKIWELNPYVQGSTNPSDYRLCAPRLERVNGQPIRCYDSGPESGADRYTIVFLNREEYGYTSEYIRQAGRDLFPCVGMSAAPFHPQGICQHGEARLGRHLGKRIQFCELPEDCRTVVLRDTQPE